MSSKTTYWCDICHHDSVNTTIYGVRWLTLGGEKLQFIPHNGGTGLMSECLQHLCSRCIDGIKSGVYKL